MQINGQAVTRSLKVVMLDTRYNRDITVPTDRDACEASTNMLGDVQWNWLDAELRDSADVLVSNFTYQFRLYGNGATLLMQANSFMWAWFCA